MSRDERLDVLDVVWQFAAAIDGRDWPGYRAVFRDEIDVDYSSYRPGSVARMPAQEWVDRAQRLFPGLDATQHTITNARVTIDGDRAVVRSYVRADHFLAGRRYSLGGSYVHRLSRERASWLIDGVTLLMTWDDGDRAVLQEAAAATDQRGLRADSSPG